MRDTAQRLPLDGSAGQRIVDLLQGDKVVSVLCVVCGSCEQIWNGTAKIGKPTGCKLPLLHHHNNGVNTNISTQWREHQDTQWRDLQGKHGVEIRIESVNNDNSHSWVRISHGLNKLVTDLIDKKYDDNEQESSTTKAEVFAIASRAKAKAKPRRPATTCSSSRTIPILERKWIDIEPGAQFDQAFPVAKKHTHSSSTRRITSRRRWCDRILETEGRSSE